MYYLGQTWRKPASVNTNVVGSISTRRNYFFNISLALVTRQSAALGSAALNTQRL